jgi:FkbM family methyltransferase
MLTMQIDQAALPLLSALRMFGLNHHVRGWNRVLGRLFPHGRQQSRHLAVPRWGVTYLANPANYIDWNVLCFGGYERDDLKVFRRLGRPGATCLDIGANVGHHAIFFGSLGWSVHAFEPNPQLWNEFDRKVVVSGLSSVTLHKVGLGHEDGLLQFELENETNSGTGHFTTDSDQSRGRGQIQTLPVRNGDRYLAEAGIGHVDVVKMDIQGFEPEALAGLRETLRRDRPLLCIEVSLDNSEKFESFDGLRRCLPGGYSFFHICNQNVGPLRTGRFKNFSGDINALRGNLFAIPLGRSLDE